MKQGGGMPGMGGEGGEDLPDSDDDEEEESAEPLKSATGADPLADLEGEEDNDIAK